MHIVEVARLTRIPLHFLEAIENDHFNELPGEVFVRGFLKVYASAVGLSPSEIVERYTEGRPIVCLTPLPVVAPFQSQGEEHNRRFGLAIAFVLLLTLFVLALSIVLKPRGYDMPVELSYHLENSGWIVSRELGWG
ncbi:hypothetical protein BCY86_06225 [Pajaroellobacter abortibovis]|uniref:Helix-turn-helix domain-containing protein n=2 Tax=Pajaroellobacter abortibovis TaxID=1882918 RepID=A0A1L6MZU7_9BACT|nr:hypothetical protein BCY86_06225 [Pajaroellobacter abortibovis]